MDPKNFITTDGHGFDTLAAAQAHIASVLSARNGYQMCVVQEVRLLDNGGWEHFVYTGEDADFEAQFVAAAHDAWFCVFNPLTGESQYVNGKPAAQSAIDAVLQAHAVSCGITRVFQYTGDETTSWPYVEVQP